MLELMKAELDIRNFTRRRAPSVPYAKLAARVLPGWDISLAFPLLDKFRTHFLLIPD